MRAAEIEILIIEVLKELQAGADGTPHEITPGTRPLLDLEFFDSLLAIETTVVLEEHLKCKFAVDSVFVDRDTDAALTISEIAACITMSSEAGASHD
jgi:acyl carrier protein